MQVSAWLNPEQSYAVLSSYEMPLLQWQGFHCSVNGPKNFPPSLLFAKGRTLPQCVCNVPSRGFILAAFKLMQFSFNTYRLLQGLEFGYRCTFSCQNEFPLPQQHSWLMLLNPNMLKCGSMSTSASFLRKFIGYVLNVVLGGTYSDMSGEFNFVSFYCGVFYMNIIQMSCRSKEERHNVTCGSHLKFYLHSLRLGNFNPEVRKAVSAKRKKFIPSIRPSFSQCKIPVICSFYAAC